VVIRPIIAYPTLFTAAEQTAVNQIGTAIALDGGTATLAGMLIKMVDDNGGADFQSDINSLKVLSDYTVNVNTALGATDIINEEVTFWGQFKSRIGTPVSLDSGDASLTGMLTKMADDNGGADFDATTDSLEKLRTKVDALPASTLDAAGVRTAVGLTSANLDTQIADIPTVVEFEARTLVAADYTVVSDLGVVQTGDSYAIVNGDHGLVSIQDDVDAILADTNELQTNQGNWLTATGFSTHSAADVVTAMELNGSKLDHVWEMTEDDGGVRRLTANALEQSPAVTGFATPTNVTDAVTAIETYGDTKWLTATGFATPTNVTDAVTAVLNSVVEGTITLKQAQRLMLSFISGKASGGNTATPKFRDLADTKDRITMTVDMVGNRTAVTLDVTD
jgi:hypothetical protein